MNSTAESDKTQIATEGPNGGENLLVEEALFLFGVILPASVSYLLARESIRVQRNQLQDERGQTRLQDIYVELLEQLNRIQVDIMWQMGRSRVPSPGLPDGSAIMGLRARVEAFGSDQVDDLHQELWALIDDRGDYRALPEEEKSKFSKDLEDVMDRLRQQIRSELRAPRRVNK